MGKKSGPSPDDYNKPTPQEWALADVAAKYWNDRQANGVPLENAYIKDVTGIEPGVTDPAQMRDVALTTAGERTDKVQGQATADIYQGMGPLPLTPNKIPSIAKPAKMAAKVQGDISRDVVAQQAATTMGIVEGALGGQQAADSALEGMAADAVQRNINNVESEFNNSASTKRSAMTFAGMGLKAATDDKLRK